MKIIHIKELSTFLSQLDVIVSPLCSMEIDLNLELIIRVSSICMMQNWHRHILNKIHLLGKEVEERVAQVIVHELLLMMKRMTWEKLLSYRSRLLLGKNVKDKRRSKRWKVLSKFLKIQQWVLIKMMTLI